MMHVEQGELQAYLDHEIDARTRADIDAHLHACTACAAELDRLSSASSLFRSFVKHSDVQAPAFAAYAAIGTVQRDVAEKRTAFRAPALARAAMLVVGVAALASATIPGSPVRAWLSDALRAIGVLSNEVPPAQPAAAPDAAAPEARADETSALSIQPVDGRVHVILTNVGTAATVRVRLVDSDRASVYASGAAVQARFKTSPGRIEVLGVERGQIVVELPRSATDARVEVDGKVLFENSR